MFGQPEVLDFLHSHSVDEGERIQLIQKMRDYVIIGAKESRFAMGNEIADRIQV
ncbi:MAG: ferrous iron transport protein A [Lachnospiraceae bacterium]|jgi:Fe2+ transport system protein FeoA|nr:ferrous iron transport protein A [Lachnospiraceae bacterium]